MTEETNKPAVEATEDAAATKATIEAMLEALMGKASDREARIAKFNAHRVSDCQCGRTDVLHFWGIDPYCCDIAPVSMSTKDLDFLNRTAKEGAGTKTGSGIGLHPIGDGKHYVLQLGDHVGRNIEGKPLSLGVSQEEVELEHDAIEAAGHAVTFALRPDTDKDTDSRQIFFGKSLIVALDEEGNIATPTLAYGEFAGRIDWEAPAVEAAALASLASGGTFLTTGGPGEALVALKEIQRRRDSGSFKTVAVKAKADGTHETLGVGNHEDMAALAEAANATKH